MLEAVGLIANFIGSLLIAFAVGKNPAGAHQMVNGKKQYLTIINLRLFRIGIITLIIGFVIQFFSLLI